MRGLGDFHFYHEQAKLLAAGKGWIEPFDVPYGVEHPSANHPPLWPLLLAVPSLVGLDSFDAHRITGIVVGAAVVVPLVALIGRRLGGDRAGLVAAVLAAASPILVGADGSLLSETLYGVFVAVAVLAALSLRERPGPAPAAVLGVAGGLAALTRGEGLVLVACLGLAALAWAPGSPRRRLVLLAATAGACVLTLAPWTIRNAVRMDAFVPVSTNEGGVFAGANCDAAYRGPDLGGWVIGCIPIPPRPYADEAAHSERWREQGLEYAREHAGRLPVVVPVRILRTFQLWQPRRQAEFAEGRPRWLAHAGAAWFLLLAPLALAGLVVLRRRGAPVSVLLAVPVAVTVTSAVGYGVPRFRHAVDLVMLAVVACLLVHLRERAAAPPASGPAG